MRILIVGADAAGMSAASQISRRQPAWQVEVFEMGPRSSYALCGTPYYLSGVVKTLDELVAITPEQFERERGIKVHIHHQVMSVDAAGKTVLVKDLNSGAERKEAYDNLVIATGAEAIVPKGLEPGPANLFYLRSLDDAQNIRLALKTARNAVVVGGGYIGLEVAENLAEKGLSVTVLGREVAPIFEPELRELAAQILAKHGVNFRANTDAVGVRQLDDGRLEVAASQGEPVEADLVVVGAGVRPRVDLAASAGLELGARGAIKVDRQQRTSDPHIYAAGDCCQSYHLVSQEQVYLALALGANRQGRVAGRNICGLDDEFPGVLGSSVMKLFELGLARTGLGLEEAQKSGFPTAVKTVVKQNNQPGYYPGSHKMTAVLIHEPNSGRILGAQIAGSVEAVAQRINMVAAAIMGGLKVRDLAGLDTAYAPPFAPVYDPLVVAAEVALKKM